MAHIWKTKFCDYDLVVDKAHVTTLSWTCTRQEGEISGSLYGTVSAADQNRVYTLAALQVVPESVMTGWVKAALDVQEIEDAIDAQIAEAQVPTSGRIVPA